MVSGCVTLLLSTEVTMDRSGCTPVHGTPFRRQGSSTLALAGSSKAFNLARVASLAWLCMTVTLQRIAQTLLSAA